MGKMLIISLVLVIEILWYFIFFASITLIVK